MVDIRITYETLFDLLRREKNRDELQTLDKDFYEQVSAYLNEKKTNLTKKGDELFASAEREKLKIQFQNIRRLIKELYERREKKIINIAIGKARTGSDVIDTSALLPSEKHFFEDQVLLFMKYRESVLDAIIDIKQSAEKNLDAASSVQATRPESVSTVSTANSFGQETDHLTNTPLTNNLTGADNTGVNAALSAAEPVNPAEKPETKVRILSQLPSFLGRNGAVLGPFDEGDEVAVDSFIAELLVKRGNAEPC